MGEPIRKNGETRFATQNWKPALVTIVMPVRSDASDLQRSLRSVLKQDYPVEQMEILVVDPGYHPHTVNVVNAFREQYPGHRVYFLPSELKVAWKLAKGDIIIRVEANCEISRNYVSRCVDIFRMTKIDCVGSPVETQGETRVAQALAMAQNSSFGIAERPPGKVPLNDCISYGAYRREVFDRIGGIEDKEFSLRLIQSGGKIWMDPKIASRYYCRSNFQKFWQQYYQYGSHRLSKLPAILFLIIFLNLILAVLTGFWTTFAMLGGTYFIANLTAALLSFRGNLGVLLILPIAFATLHIAYCVGFWTSLFRRFRLNCHWKDPIY